MSTYPLYNVGAAPPAQWGVSLGGVLGWDGLPQGEVIPFLGQGSNAGLVATSIMHHNGSAPDSFSPHTVSVPFPQGYAPTQLLVQADALIVAQSLGEAGQLYRTAREAMQRELLSPDDRLYQAATYGEALYFGGADVETLKAFDRILGKLEARESALGDHPSPDSNVVRETKKEVLGDKFSLYLARWSLVCRLGGSDRNTLRNSVAELEEIIREADTNDVRHRRLVVQAYLSQVDIQLQIGVGVNNRSSDWKLIRREHFRRAVDALSNLRTLLSSGMSEGERTATAHVHRYAMEILWRHHYVEWALEVGREFNAFSPNSAIPLLQVQQGIIPRLTAALAEGVHQARFSTTGNYWSHALWGSAAAVGGMAAAGATGVADVDGFRDLIDPAWIGALAAVAAGKIREGVVADETKQAFATGITDRQIDEVFFAAIRRTAEIGFTYALFGGPLPLGGVVSGALGQLISETNGFASQLHGPGSAVAAIADYLTTNLGGVATSITDHGIGSGLEASWRHYAQHDPLGNSLQRSGRVYGRFGDYVLSGELWDEVGSWVATKLADPHSRDLLIVPEAASLFWSGLTMARPDVRNRLLRVAPGWLRFAELALLPGAWLMGADIGMALGVSPYDAYRNSLIGIAKYIFFHTMLGGNGFRDIDAANMARNALVVSLYAGVGGQMAPPQLPTVADKFLASMGIQIGLIPIGVIHFLLLGCPQFRWPLPNAWENKWKRSFTVELVNILRLSFGWASWLGTSVAELAQAMLSPSMQRLAHEGTGGQPQRSTFISANSPQRSPDGVLDPEEMGAILDDVNTRDTLQGKWWYRLFQRLVGRSGETREALAFNRGDADFAALARGAYNLRSQAAKAGRKVKLSQPFTGRSATEVGIPVLALPFAVANKPDPYPTQAEELYYLDTVYATLMADGKKGLSPGEADQFLIYLGIIAHDTDLQFRDVAHNLLVATLAARNGPHAAAIDKFFDANGWVFNYYGIHRDLQLPSRNRSQRVRWFIENLIGSEGVRRKQVASSKK